MSLDPRSDSICAVATPPGRGGISVIRVSGPQAREIVSTIAPFLPLDCRSHTIHYGHLKRFDQSEVIDEVLVSFFEAGRSFTGEEVIEISCHGNPLICREVLSELVKAGCRIADKGELTFRAFMNGLIDLVQAESVLELIESQSNQEIRNSLNQLDGEISSGLRWIEKKLIFVLAHIEASIDFSTENLETYGAKDLIAVLDEVQERIEKMIEGYRCGRVLRDGFRVLFFGKPNAGKSSLLNLILGTDRSIVTEEAGTTRDLVEGWTEIQGLRVSWVDSAGIRKSESVVERLGVERAISEIQNSDLIFWVVELGGSPSTEELSALQKVKESTSEVNQGSGGSTGAPACEVVLLGSKADISSNPRREIAEILHGLTKSGFKVGMEAFAVSTVKEGGDVARSLILELVEKRIQALGGGANSAVLSQARHFEGLAQAQRALRGVQEIADEGLGCEIWTVGLKEALFEVQEILGVRYDDQIIDRIFKDFCLGK